MSYVHTYIHTTGGDPSPVPTTTGIAYELEKRQKRAAHFVAMKSTLSTSLTPARRHESIWQTSIASAWRSCLNTIRLCACSPVATPIPCCFSARRMAACPRTSSGAVGSSMNLTN